MRCKPALIASVSVAALLVPGPAPGAAGTNLHDHRQLHVSQPSSSGGLLVAPPAACPGQELLDAPRETQLEAMACLVNFARSRAGLPDLAVSEMLAASSQSKAHDILGCDSFSHSACGRDFTYWFGSSGYLAEPCWRVGENIAWGQNEYATARSVFQAFLRSAAHREILLRPFFIDLGVGLAVGDLAGRKGTRVWTQHFGVHDCNATR